MSGQSPYLTRFELDEDEERDDGYLYASGRGRAGHAPKHILQPQSFGTASRPPKGSVGMQLALGGDHSTSLLIGTEHPDHRPKLPAGGSAIYDQWGGILKWVEEGLVVDTKNRTAVLSAKGWTIKATEGFAIEAPSGVTIVGDVAIQGSMTITGGITAGGSIVDVDGDGGA
jgi:phage gp45-like